MVLNTNLLTRGQAPRLPRAGGPVRVFLLFRLRLVNALRPEAILEGEARQRVRGYSLGMQQRLGIAQALLTDPPVLVLDEPANGLDPQGQRWLGELLRARAERGAAILLSSHQLFEVERLADRLAIIADGRIVAHDTLASMQAEHGDITEFYFSTTADRDRTA